MSRTTRRFFSASAAALGIAFTGLFSSLASAASISYGNIGPAGPGVTFLNIVESSGTDGVPLFGAPTGFPSGLDFNPSGFVASSAGGGGDLTDGQLNFTVMDPGVNSILVFESGDYTLTGVGTAATQAFAGVSIRAVVTQLDGVDVAPIYLTGNSASVAFNLLANPGVLQPWALNTLIINVPAQLAINGYFNQQATKVDVVIDNQLVAISEPGSTSFIGKHEFVITVNPTVPEPSTLALADLALCGLGAAARKRR